MLLVLLGVAGYFTYVNYFGGTPNAVSSLISAQDPPKRLTPDGTFFVTDRHSEISGEGVRAIQPGTRVKAVGSPEPGKTTIRTDDGIEFLVSNDILTNDLDVIDRVLTAVRRQIQDAQEQTDATMAIRKQEFEKELQSKHKEVERLGILLGELNLARERAIEKLQVEAAKSREGSISGGASIEEQRARAAIAEIEKNIRKAETSAENLRLAIRRHEFRDF